MRIQTGQGTIPLITLIGIWSISALNALPGLAVSPILGKLSAIFPHSTELEVNWHLPFIVYLFPLISIVLSFYLKKNISPYPDTSMHATVKPVASQAEMKPAYGTTDNSFGKFGIQIRHLMQIMAFYGLATYLVIIISFNLPFLMKEYHFTSGNSGIMISLFFLAGNPALPVYHQCF